MISGGYKQDAQKDAARYVKRQIPPVSRLDELQTLFRESGEGGEPAAEADTQEKHQLLRGVGEPAEQSPQQADQQAADEVDKEGGPREPAGVFQS